MSDAQTLRGVRLLILAAIAAALIVTEAELLFVGHTGSNNGQVIAVALVSLGLITVTCHAIFPKYFKRCCVPFHDVSVRDFRRRWTFHALSLGCSIGVESATRAGGKTFTVCHTFRKDSAACSCNADRDRSSRAHLYIPTSARRSIR